MIRTIKDMDGFIEFAFNELMLSKAISAATNFREAEGWSSLNALIFVSRINEEFGIFVSSEDLASMTTFGDVYQLIQLRLNGNS